MNSKTHSFDKRYYLLLFLLAISLSPFTNNGAKYMLLSFLLSLTVTIVTPFQQLFDKNAKVVLWFSLSYAIIGFLSHSIDNLPFALFIGIVPPFLYVLGRYFAIVVNDINRLSDLFLIIAVSLASYVFWMALTGQQFVIRGVAEERALLDTSGEILLSATAVGTLVSIGLVGLFIALSCKTLTLIRKIGWVGLFLLSLYIVTFFINRAGVYVVIICGIFFLFQEVRKRRKSNAIISVIIILILILVVLNLNLISDQLISSYEARNMEEDDRWRRWSEALGLLLTHPLGFTGSMRYYVHNMWLDVARISGWIPFVFIVILTVRSIRSSINLIRNKGNEIYMLLLYIFLCMTLSCAVEPLIQGVPLYFLVYVLVIGMVAQYDRESKILNTLN